MIRRYGIVLLAVAGLAAAVAVVVRGNRTVPAPGAPVAAAVAPFPSYIFGAGIVEAGTENITIGTPVAGIVTDIYVTRGQPVTRGAPLFRIDARDVEAQLIPARAAVTEAEARVPVARAHIHEAQATLARSEYRLKAGEGLTVGTSITEEDIANRRFDVAVDRAALASAAAEFDHVTSAVATARGRVAQLEREVALRTVRAPVPGRILRMPIHLGEYAQAGALTVPLILLGGDTRLHVRVDINEADAWRFQPCASAVASLRGNPAIKAPLQYVRTDLDVVPQQVLTGDATQRTDARVLQVIYAFDRGSRPVYVGQLMDVFIEATSAADTTAGPRAAVTSCGGDAGTAGAARRGRNP